jgi:hypothetical protein
LSIASRLFTKTRKIGAAVQQYPHHCLKVSAKTDFNLRSRAVCKYDVTWHTPDSDAGFSGLYSTCTYPNSKAPDPNPLPIFYAS